MRLDEIKDRLKKLPERLEVVDTKVPMKIRDPQTGKLIPDPRGRLQQTRMDIIDADDPHKIPIVHFHRFPDHPAYAGENWKYFAEMFVNAHADLNYLISLLEGKTNG